MGDTGVGPAPAGQLTVKLTADGANATPVPRPASASTVAIPN